MKVFVTGGSGFIGSRVVRRLAERGHGVRCLLRPASRTHRIDDLPFERHPGDLLDPESLARGLEGCRACIHLAGVSSWEEIAREDVEGAIVGGTRLVVAACREAGAVRLVYVSSAAAVNGSREPRLFDERSAFELAGSGLRYAVAKHRAEGEVLAAAADGLDALVVNPVETYGPEDEEWVTAGSIRDALRGWPALAVRGGTSVAHVDDVALGIVLALERGRRGERYILGGDNLSVAELVRRVVGLAGRRKPVVVLPTGLVRLAIGFCRMLGLSPPIAPEVLDYASRFWYMDSTKAASELGYGFRSGDETLAAVVGWVSRVEAAGRQDGVT